MRISTILDHIDLGELTLPEFQRGYVWNREQVRAFMDSLYKRHPVGSLLVWVTEAGGSPVRGSAPVPGTVRLLLDGQQRITTLYALARGKPPPFFQGKKEVLEGLHFHLEGQRFEFWQPVKMRDDPLWIGVTDLLRNGIERTVASLSGMRPDEIVKYISRISRLYEILGIDLHIEEVTGRDKTIEVVVDIFNRLNSGGTKLSHGDLALAKICASWPGVRGRLLDSIKKWQEQGYSFSLDWLLRCVNAQLTGEAKFHHLHEVSGEAFAATLQKTVSHIDSLLNVIADRLGLDHDRVLFGRYAFPVMVRWLDRRGQGTLSQKDLDLLLFWYLQAAMRGRFSGSTETAIERDLEAVDLGEGTIGPLIENLRRWHPRFVVSAEDFSSWSVGSRFYPVLYMLTRVRGARDWGTGIAIKKSLLGPHHAPEVHHIFPKAALYRHGYKRSDVNAIANFCLLAKSTNLRIGDRLPEEYFDEVEEKFPGALASQWIPMDRALWRVSNYRDFLAARRELLAEATNAFLHELAGEYGGLLDETRAVAPTTGAKERLGTIATAEGEEELVKLRMWLVDQGLSAGVVEYELPDRAADLPAVILDLAWPEGLQPGLGEPVCLLLNEPPEVLAAASEAGFRCFTSADALERWVRRELLHQPVDQAA
jgi:hypothetical protein